MCKRQEATPIHQVAEPFYRSSNQHSTSTNRKQRGWEQKASFPLEIRPREQAALQSRPTRALPRIAYQKQSSRRVYKAPKQLFHNIM